MNSYHFSVGNSTEGPVGFCARVSAKSKAEALVKLRRALEHGTGVVGELPIQFTEPGIEYINVYISPQHVRLQDVDDD
ncbi:MAG: hypothetical protein ACLQOO_15215 [Terriglobia bacterium]